MRSRIISAVLVAVLAVTDYLLFREFELVWPFFVLPYLFFSLLFFIFLYDKEKRELFTTAIYLLVIIPVFAGLTMSIGWMIKIDFVGEMIRTFSQAG